MANSASDLSRASFDVTTGIFIFVWRKATDLCMHKQEEVGAREIDNFVQNFAASPLPLSTRFFVTPSVS